MPGGGSTGGETQQVRPPKYQEDALNNVLGRGQNLSQQGSLGLYEQPWAQRNQNLASMWGGSPAAVGQAYGLTPGQTDVGIRTGVAGLNSYDQAAINRSNDLSYSPLSSLYGTAQGTAANLMGGGIGDWGQQAVRGFQNLSSQGIGPWGQDAVRTAQGLASGGIGDWGQQAVRVAQGQAGDPLGDYGRNAYNAANRTASGAYLSPDSNPYLQGMYGAAAKQATDAFNTQTLPALTSQFSSSGRYGSGAQQNVEGRAASDLQRNLGDMASNLYGNAYAQERGLQEGAIGQMANLYGQSANIQQGAGNQLGQLGQANAQIQGNAANQLGQLGQADASLRAGAFGQLGNLGQANAQIQGNAAQMAPGLASAPWQQQAQQIAMQGQLGQGQRDLQNQLFGAAGQNQEGIVQNPYERVGWYSNIVNGMPGGFGTTTGGQQQQGGFNAGGALGGGMSGAMMGSMFGPYGMAVGGGLGLLGGGFF